MTDSPTGLALANEICERSTYMTQMEQTGHYSQEIMKKLRKEYVQLLEKANKEASTLSTEVLQNIIDNIDTTHTNALSIYTYALENHPHTHLPERFKTIKGLPLAIEGLMSIQKTILLKKACAPQSAVEEQAQQTLAIETLIKNDLSSLTPEVLQACADLCKSHNDKIYQELYQKELEKRPAIEAPIPSLEPTAASVSDPIALARQVYNDFTYIVDTFKAGFYSEKVMRTLKASYHKHLDEAKKEAHTLSKNVLKRIITLLKTLDDTYMENEALTFYSEVLKKLCEPTPSSPIHLSTESFEHLSGFPLAIETLMTGFKVRLLKSARATQSEVREAVLQYRALIAQIQKDFAHLDAQMLEDCIALCKDISQDTADLYEQELKSRLSHNTVTITPESVLETKALQNESVEPEPKVEFVLPSSTTCEISQTPDMEPMPLAVTPKAEPISPTLAPSVLAATTLVTAKPEEFLQIEIPVLPAAISPQFEASRQVTPKAATPKAATPTVETPQVDTLESQKTTFHMS